MTPEQSAYVARRRRQVYYWPWVAAILVLLMVAGYAWLWQHEQVSVNPFLMLDQFNHKTFSDDELILLAARGSLAMVACGLLVLLVILLVSVAVLNEWRLIRILESVAPVSAAPGTAAGNGAAEASAEEAAEAAAEGLPEGVGEGTAEGAAQGSAEPPVGNG